MELDDFLYFFFVVHDFFASFEMFSGFVMKFYEKSYNNFFLLYFKQVI